MLCSFLFSFVLLNASNRNRCTLHLQFSDVVNVDINTQIQSLGRYTKTPQERFLIAQAALHCVVAQFTHLSAQSMSKEEREKLEALYKVKINTLQQARDSFQCKDLEMQKTEKGLVYKI